MSIKSTVKKYLTKEIVLYIFFGVLTTLVNWGAFAVLRNLLNFGENTANLAAICLAVIFAYLTNRGYVFHSKARSFREKFSEFSKFAIGRAFTAAVEFFGCMLLFLTPIPELVTKGMMTVLVVVLNFLVSKYFSFRHK